MKLSQTSKVLLADDDTAITTDLAPFLKRGGFRVEIAVDGEQALERICSSKPKPDIIILDLIMPKMDGRKVLRQLRNEDNWINIEFQHSQ